MGMPSPINPQSYRGRYLNHPSELDGETHGVLVPNQSGQSNQAGRLIVFKERQQWERYLRDMAQRGHQWRDFTPIVFKTIDMGVVMIDAADAVEAVETAATDVHQPIDSRLSLLTGED